MRSDSDAVGTDPVPTPRYGRRRRHIQLDPDTEPIPHVPCGTPVLVRDSVCSAVPAGTLRCEPDVPVVNDQVTVPTVEEPTTVPSNDTIGTTAFNAPRQVSEIVATRAPPTFSNRVSPSAPPIPAVLPSSYIRPMHNSLGSYVPAPFTGSEVSEPYIAPVVSNPLPIVDWTSLYPSDTSDMVELYPNIFTAPAPAWQQPSTPSTWSPHPAITWPPQPVTHVYPQITTNGYSQSIPDGYQPPATSGYPQMTANVYSRPVPGGYPSSATTSPYFQQNMEAWPQYSPGASPGASPYVQQNTEAWSQYSPSVSTWSQPLEPEEPRATPTTRRRKRPVGRAPGFSPLDPTPTPPLSSPRSTKTPKIKPGAATTPNATTTRAVATPRTKPHAARIPYTPTMAHTPTTSLGDDDNNPVYQAEDPSEASVPRLEKVDRAAETGILTLTAEQEEVVRLVREGYNVMISGSPGTGKSALIRHLIRLFGTHPDEVGDSDWAVTAMTGVAALLVNGGTLHSRFGLRPGDTSATQLSQSVKRFRPDVYNRWRSMRILSTDEVSMLDADLFDMLEYASRMVRGNNLPFGGIQLVLSGDFAQLPPVAKGAKFAFESFAWTKCDIRVQILTVPFRQAESGDLFALLQEIRMGQCSPESLALLRSRDDAHGPVALFGTGKDVPGANNPNNVTQTGVEPTRLFARVDQVQETNRRHLERLTTDSFTFRAEYTGAKGHVTVLKGRSTAQDILELKVGAQVMLLRNVDTSAGLVNGARGVVMSFNPNKPHLPVVQFTNGELVVVQRERWTFEENGKTLATMTQVPLALAWAATVHKCQGLTVDLVEINCRNIFAPGQFYVALSRVKSLDRAIIRDFDESVIKVHPAAVKFYRKHTPQPALKTPVVQDTSGNDASGTADTPTKSSNNTSVLPPDMTDPVNDVD